MRTNPHPSDFRGSWVVVIGALGTAIGLLILALRGCMAPAAAAADTFGGGLRAQSSANLRVETPSPTREEGISRRRIHVGNPPPAIPRVHPTNRSASRIPAARRAPFAFAEPGVAPPQGAPRLASPLHAPGAAIQPSASSARAPQGHAGARLGGAVDALDAVQFLDTLEQVESGGRANAIGDGGRARGSFQFWAVAWKEANRLRASAGMERIPYSKAMDRAAARQQASIYVQHLRGRLARALGRPATAPEVWAAWNLGYDGFKRRGFKLEACPAVTRREARRF